MAAEGHDVIGIKFGVLGGGSIDGWSGQNIKTQLEAIAENILLNVKVQADEVFFKDQLARLKNELDATLGKLEINIDTKEAKRVTGGGLDDGKSAKKEEVSYESLRKTLENLYKTKVKLLKVPVTDEGKQATVNGELLQREEQRLQELYSQQLEELKKIGEADSKRTEEIEKQISDAESLKAALQEAYQEQQNASAAPKMATITDVAKLQLKAQSLRTDNGFDKVIARSKDAKKAVDAFDDSVKAALNHPESLTKEKVTELNAEFLKTETRLKELQVQTNTFGNKVKEAFSAGVIQRFARMLILLIAKALRQVYQNVKEIDAAMTQLSIVTQATGTQLKAASESIRKSAMEIGASVADLTNSVTTFARLGFDLSKAQTLAKLTTIYGNVANIDVSTATSNVTAAIKAFDITTDNLEEALDKFIYVGK